MVVCLRKSSIHSTLRKDTDSVLSVAVHIKVNGETITCTPEHPFYVQGNGWAAAKNLKTHDKLELQNGKSAVVDVVKRENLPEPIAVYNFEVEGFHTYYVGTECILVHNDCGNHGKLWGHERRKHWREQGRLYKDNINNQLSNSGTYVVSQRNVDRMLRGVAPIGTDDLSVVLHHNVGILTDFYNYSELLSTDHRARFKELHSWVF